MPYSSSTYIAVYPDSLRPLQFPYDIWLQIAAELVSDTLLSARQSAYSRGAVASVNKEWNSRVYGSPSLWSKLVVDPALPLSRLAFYLGKCERGPVDIVLPFCDLNMLGAVRATPVLVQAFIIGALAILSSQSARWRSFDFEMDQSAVYRQVFVSCSGVRAIGVKRIRVAYFPLRGPHRLFHADELQPAVYPPGSTWFGGRFDALHDVSLYCVPVWLAAMTRVKTIALVEYTNPAPLTSAILSSIFAVSSCLTSIRIGPIIPFRDVGPFALVSRTLVELDLDFFTGEFAGLLFSALRAPMLSSLTVRGVDRYVQYLLARPDILANITHFRVFSELGDRVTLQHVYTALTSMTSLDLQHGRAIAFEIYREWADTRVRLGQSCLASRLRAILLPACDFRTVHRIVLLVASNMPFEATSVGVDLLRVHHPGNRVFSADSLQWIRNLVPDFAFTTPVNPVRLSAMSYTGVSSNILSGRTFHTEAGLT
ncbi:hypothetical protein C8R46DRAFT_1207161 [Mycena filopes]|nr:hypothetical protein C8R46DRAFT_1207161 [Mycena filopes]